MAGELLYRQPTIKEAANLILISRSREYRKDCLRYFEEKFGSSFALSVRKGVEKQWAKRRGGGRARHPR